MPNRCGNCQKRNATSRCSQCKLVYYCNKKCQRNHWKIHKRICQKTRKEMNDTQDQTIITINNMLSQNSHKNSNNPHHIEILSPDIIFTSNDLDWTDDTVLGMNTAEVKSCESPISPSCQLEECGSLRNISGVIRNHNDSKRYQNMNTINVINDYHHLINKHHSAFEDIYNHLISESVLGNACDKLSCTLLRRNNRDRRKCSQNDQIRQSWYGNRSGTEIKICQLLDGIHCCLLHTFDVGYKFTTDEWSLIEEQKQENEKLLKKLQIVQRKKRHNAQGSKTKFVSNHKMFHFGYWYIYPKWDAFEFFAERDPDRIKNDIQQIYAEKVAVSHKYSSFKHEMISNKIHTISNNQWSGLITTVTDYLNSDYCMSHQPTQIDKYAFFTTDGIKLHHLLSLRIYCGFDTLSTAFSETFRTLTKGESIASVVLRHREFSYFGKYLKEVCYYFGNNLHDDITLYHGINTTLLFDQSFGTFYCPFSTSTDIAVAINFTQVNGMLLTMNRAPSNSSGKACRCGWISPFANEQEVLLYGTEALYISSILTPTGENYSIYLNCLNAIESFFKNQWFHSQQKDGNALSKQIKYMILRLLSNELYKYDPDHPKSHMLKDIPKYIESLFHHYCISMRGIEIPWCFLHLECGENPLSSYKGFKFAKKKFLCVKDLSFIDAQLLVTLFPNATNIYVIINKKEDEGQFGHKMLDAFFIYLKSSNDNGQLRVIEFIPSQQDFNAISKQLNKYNAKFLQFRWIINVLYKSHVRIQKQ
eukprot:355675_1